MNTRKKLLVGSTFISGAAMEAIQAGGQPSTEFLRRHEAGDWGEILSTQDRQSNEMAVADGLAVTSAYLLQSGDTLWVVTEAGGTVTWLWLESER